MKAGYKIINDHFSKNDNCVVVVANHELNYILNRSVSQSFINNLGVGFGSKLVGVWRIKKN
jgi:hypothetical protein